MGIQRFRLSDMIPNALFYKLRNLGKKNRTSNLNNNNKEPLSTSSYSTASKATSQPQRKSYHFPREHQNSPPPPPPHYIYLEPPRKSSKKRRSSYRRSSSRTSTPRLPPSSSASGICSCRPSTDSAWTNKPDSTPEYYPDSPLDSTSSSSSGKDSIYPELVSRPVLSAASPGKFAGIPLYDDHDRFESGPKIELPPIITKPIVNHSDESTRIKGGPNQPCKCGGNSDGKKVRKKKACCGGPVHRISGNSPAGLKLRTNSPRIGRIQGRRSLSSRKNILPESFAVVKTSQDPQRDFRESMVEMIVENNIRTSGDLENLLACFLSMNSDEYHDLIIKVFKQIWFDIANLRLK